MSSFHVQKRLAASPVLLLLITGVPGYAQYVGKVGQATEKKQTLRATAIYEYTGSMTKPSASRLVPVVVWDGERYEPGGLYLAKPEPLAVAPGTQYVLEPSGVPAGLFNVSAAGQLNGSWVGLGRFAAEPAAPPPAKLARSKKPPTLTGGTGRGKIADAGDDADSNSSGPVLHRKAGSDSDTASTTSGSGSGPGTASGSGSGSGSGSNSGSGSSSSEPTLHRRDTTSSTADSSDASAPADPDRPTLHRKDTGDDAGSSSTTGTSTTASSDPDRPTLHRSTDTGSSAPSVDPDRPTLHRHADTGTLETSAPDPDRPHLRYGEAGDVNSRVLPTELKEFSTPGMAVVAGSPVGANGTAPVTIGQTVAISDTEADEPHPFRFSWPSVTAQADTEAAMHAFALRALATAAQATFGPAAKASQKTAADLQQAATAAERKIAAGSGSATQTAAAPGRSTAAKHAATSAPTADPLSDAQLSAFELSYGAGATYIYSAHTTAAAAGDRRYVTVIAQPDFYGKPHLVFSQTTRGDQLNQVPALHLIDAVDADGDHRAELLFELQGAPVAGQTQPARQFALYSVTAGKATAVYASNAGQ